MGKRRISLTAAAVLGCGAAGLGAPVHADTGGNKLFVDDNAAAHCDDSTSDSSVHPFCTIGGALKKVSPGDIVQIASGYYAGPTTVTATGTANAPITITGAPGATVTLGPAGGAWSGLGGIVIDHSQYLTLANVTVYGDSNDAVTVSASDHVTVTRTTPINGAVNGIHVTGSTNTLVAGNLTGDAGEAADTAIKIDGGSSGTVVAGNTSYALNRGVWVADSSGTAVTGNTLALDCVAGIEVTGSSSGTVLENNILDGDDGVSGTGADSNAACGTTTPDPNTAAIAVAGTATAGTTVDYNAVWAGNWASPTAALYRWGGQPEDEAGFRKLGQAAHDLNADPLVNLANGGEGWLHLAEGSPAIDSADSAAAGEQAKDASGTTRVADPKAPQTGAGPRNYDDRGAFEFTDPFSVSATITGTANGVTSATVHATVSGWQNATSYTFFTNGNAKVVTDKPTADVALPTPTKPGPWSYPVTVIATEAGTGATATATGSVAVGYDTPHPVATASVAPGMLTVDASKSTPGTLPIASYEFDVQADAGAMQTVTQTGPVLKLPLAPGGYSVSVVAVDTVGGRGAMSQPAHAFVPAPPTTPVSVGRLAGSDRYTTAVAVSASHWADAAGDTSGRTAAKAVVLATGESYADAVAGVPLAAHVGGPLLLTEHDRLDAATEAEIRRVLPAHAGHTVYLLGGASALNQAVADQLVALGYQVVRYGGADRFATALDIARGLGAPTKIMVATGRDFADALAAGPVAAKEGAAILLSDGTSLDPATAAYVHDSLIHSLGTSPAVWAVGGPAFTAVEQVVHASPLTAAASVTETVGANRYRTAEQLALQFPGGTGWTGLGVATGETFADALTGGALMATLGEPLVLTEHDQLDPAVTEIPERAQRIQTVTLFGGPSALSQTVEDEIAVVMHGKEN